jgi:hypothetical protein
LGRAKKWLLAAEISTHNDRVFQLLGLGWCGAKAEKLRPFVRQLINDQRSDGGWGQLKGLESDAWATGLALLALHEAGGMPTSDVVYERGVEFLLRTQFEDGSWWVKSRSWPFQPHFDSRFPHGKDQWISAAGTAWATLALLQTFEPTIPYESIPKAQTLLARAATSPAASARDVESPRSDLGTARVDFNREIQPILERSCMGCHSGDQPRGGMNLASHAGLLNGGQSGEPAVIPGHGESSPLIRFVADQVEDLEMPPLAKRDKYPALSREEIDRLRAWIDEGAGWPE